MNSKLFFRMKMLSKEDVKSTFVAYYRSENKADAAGRKAMLDRGFIETDFQGDLLPDGREVVSVWGRRWVMSESEHAIRQERAEEIARSEAAARALENPETAETKSVAGTEAIGCMICPKCGDALQYSSVCGACAAGRAGYGHRYSCIHGCVDFVSKEKI